MVKCSKCCSKSFHRDTDRRVVFKFREIWQTGSWWNCALCVYYLTKKNKISPGSPAVATTWIAIHPAVGCHYILLARPAITSPAAEHHSLLAGIKLYCLVTEAHRCEQLAQGCYTALPGVRFEPTTCWSQVHHSIALSVAPPPPEKYILTNV